MRLLVDKRGLGLGFHNEDELGRSFAMVENEFMAIRLCFWYQGNTETVDSGTARVLSRVGVGISVS